MFKRILVPVDGSECSTRALGTALQLALDDGARVRLVHAMDEAPDLSGNEPSGELLAIWRAQAGRILRDAADTAACAGVPAEQELVDGVGVSLGEVVARAAGEWQADLVVVGTHGRRGVGRALLGSGAEQIVRMAPAPVLVVR